MEYESAQSQNLRVNALLVLVFTMTETIHLVVSVFHNLVCTFCNYEGYSIYMVSFSIKVFLVEIKAYFFRRYFSALQHISAVGARVFVCLLCKIL